jgi:hypothetical protein
VTFTASASTVSKLERAKALFGHAVPNGDVDAIIERALALLIETTEKLLVP